jgi:hypothetical protein
MNTHYPKTLAVAIGVAAFVAFFATFASLSRARAGDAIGPKITGTVTSMKPWSSKDGTELVFLVENKSGAAYRLVNWDCSLWNGSTPVAVTIAYTQNLAVDGRVAASTVFPSQPFDPALTASCRVTFVVR